MKHYRIVIPVSVDDEEGPPVDINEVSVDIDRVVNKAIDMERSNVVTGESWVLEGP